MPQSFVNFWPAKVLCCQISVQKLLSVDEFGMEVQNQHQVLKNNKISKSEETKLFQIIWGRGVYRTLIRIMFFVLPVTSTSESVSESRSSEPLDSYEDFLELELGVIISGIRPGFSQIAWVNLCLRRSQLRLNTFLHWLHSQGL